MEENLDTPVDSLFADVLGPEYWASNSGVSRRSWEILLLRKAMLDDHLWSLAECAERYGISRERVRQLEQEAVAKLLDWKKAEDERRRESRRRCAPDGSRFKIVSRAAVPPPAFRVGAAPAPVVECMSEAVECLSEESFAPPRRTFAELRDRLLALFRAEGLVHAE